ncbi:MAG: hypothetical protein WBY44_33635 [Bryobacteraceae bacterium]
MIYTCYEMIRDCRADKAEGWGYFVSNYAPVIRKLVVHYGGDFESALAMLRNPQSSPFQLMEPAPERWFVAEMRQKIVAAGPPATPDIPLDLETVVDALAPLTMTEKQAAWFETMRFAPQPTAEALRMAAGTVEKIRARADELIRGKVDSWRRELLAANGRALGLEAAQGATKDCLPAKTFLDMLDGRSTWRSREEIEQHVGKCWHCIDHFCRMAEVIEILRGMQPLSETEAAPLRKKLGIEAPKRAFWKR